MLRPRKVIAPPTLFVFQRFDKQPPLYRWEGKNANFSNTPYLDNNYIPHKVGWEKKELCLIIKYLVFHCGFLFFSLTYFFPFPIIIVFKSYYCCCTFILNRPFTCIFNNLPVIYGDNHNWSIAVIHLLEQHISHKIIIYWTASLPEPQQCAWEPKIWFRME